jgi:hypothetical protein
MKKYKNIFNNLYIVSNEPSTGETLTIESLDKYIIKADYRNVLKEAQKQECLLIRSGNPFFVKKLTSNQNLKVIPIVFQSGEHIVESWEEYKERVIFTIKSDLSQRHQYLKKHSLEWYSKTADLQKV